MKVGFIGLGNMGFGIAQNLLRAGHQLTVYNRTRSKAEALASAGAQVADTLTEACQSEVVMTMLADDAALEEVALGDGAYRQHSCRGRNSRLPQHHQHGALEETHERARQSRPGFHRRAGFRTARRRPGGATGGSGRGSAWRR